MIDPQNLHKNLQLKIFTPESECDYWIVLALFVWENERTGTGGV